MRKISFNFISTILLFLVFNLCPINTFAQNEQPLNKDQIINILDFFKKKVINARKIISDIRKRKVDFKISKDEGNELRSLGATYEIIKAINDNYAGSEIPTNPQTGTTSTILPPFTFLELSNKLAKDSSADGQKKLISEIKIRKYSGELGADNEEFLKQDNATSELIEAIKKNPFVAETVVTKSNELKNQRTGMEFLLIPKGSFMMGGDKTENEQPVRKIIFAKDFFIGKYEVTQGEWQELMGNAKEKVLKYQGNNTSLDDIIGENYPIVGVNWDDAKQFIAKLNELNDGSIYSLPSEAEWEYVCRAGTTANFFFGDDITSEQASFMDYTFAAPKYDTPEKKINKLKTIDLYPPNDWGIFGMHGNASEWVEDTYINSYKGLATDGTANTVKGDAETRILRGGGWSTPTRFFLRSSIRNYTSRNFANLATGFRVVAKKKEVAKTR